MRFNNLNKYQVGKTGSTLHLQIRPPSTPTGRIYRYSPNEEAYPRHFLIGNPVPNFEITEQARGRMKLEPRSQQTVCPYSGVIASDGDFTHPDDRQAAIDVVRQAAIADVQEAFSEMLKGVAQRSKSITFKPGARQPKPRLVFHRADLLRGLVCDHCGRDYGVYAIGLFCPDCGAPNVRLHFQRECQLVDAQVELAEAQDEGLEELSYRLLGNAHEDVLTAFEATLKAVYLFGIDSRPEGSPPVKPVVNDFQNVERGKKRFADLALDPFAGLDEEELDVLSLNIQKRHIIGHNLGVVDSKFAEHAQEARLGETVQIVGDDIKRFAAICQKVVDTLDGWLSGTPSPMIGELPIESGTPVSKQYDSPTLGEIPLDVSHLAKEIAIWMAERSQNGLGHLEPKSDVKTAFSEASTRDLAKALAELEAEGLVTLASSGRDVPFPLPTTDLYAILDPVVRGNDPHVDACTLIRNFIEEAKQKGLATYSVRSADLLSETGWPHRRLNPAVSLIIAQIDSQGVSKTSDGEFVTRFFGVGPADELALERFVKRVGG